MDVAIVAPCPVPYARGGAENHWRGFQDHINEATPHQAEIIKLPSREHEFWDLIASYRAFAALDLREFDVVVSGKYPAWMIPHPRHVVHMLHPLRGLYDTYHYFNQPEAVINPPPVIEGLLEFCASHDRNRGALDEFFDRMDEIRRQRDVLEPDLFAFPGPLIRTLIKWLDRIAMDGAARLGAISKTVRDRDDYFPAGADVFVVHPTSNLLRPPGGRRGDHLLTVGRMDEIKRIDLLIDAMGRTTSSATLRIVGTGPEERRLRELAAGRPSVRFEGRVTDAELTALYATARAVAYTAYDEDFGLVVLEGMQSARPVVVLSDGGGATELVEDGVNGLVVAPDAAAIAEAIDRLWSDRRQWRSMGQAALRSSRVITWDPLMRELEAVAAS